MKASQVVYLLRSVDKVSDDLAEWLAEFSGDLRDSKLFRSQRERKQLVEKVVSVLDLKPGSTVRIPDLLVHVTRQRHEKVCAVCGGVFRSQRFDRKTCSTKCRVRFCRVKNDLE